MHSILLEMWSIIVSWSLENTEDLTMVWTLLHVLWPAIYLHMYILIYFQDTARHMKESLKVSKCCVYIKY